MGEQSFLQQYTAGKDELDFIQVWRESLKPPYSFVENNPINSLDNAGLDRWAIWNIHGAVVVEEWNDCCTKVIGYRRIEFGPRSLGVVLTGGSVWPGEVSITTTDKPTSGLRVIHYKSDCDGDKKLLNWAQAEQKHPPLYSLYFYNCNDFADEALSMGLPLSL